MKSITEFASGTVAALMIFAPIALWLTSFAMYVVGLIGAFQVHVMAGIAAIFLGPITFVSGIGLFFFQYDLYRNLALAINLI